jgi:hypothetical protein
MDPNLQSPRMSATLLLVVTCGVLGADTVNPLEGGMAQRLLSQVQPLHTG